MKRILATILVAASSLFAARAQVKIVTVRAEGKCEISRFITKEQAEQKALQEAKNEALQKAGVDENVWSVFGMISQNDGQEFHQAYSEMSVLAVGGLVHLIEEPTYTETYSKSEKRRYIVCKIRAEVKKGETVDKSFQIKVNGLSHVYNNGDALNLTLEASQDCYVRVFWFNKSAGEQILPNVCQASHQLKKDTPMTIPGWTEECPAGYELLAEKQDANSKIELVNIMVIATKKDYPFYESEVTFDTLLNWIYDIPASERCTFYETFDIK